MLAAQRDDATPAVLVAHALVEREQARVEAGDGVRAPPRDLRGLGVERGVPGVARGRALGRGGLELGVRRLELREGLLVRLEALHDVELDLLEDALPARERLELGDERLRVLRPDLAGVQAGLVAGGARPHLLHVALGLGQLAPEVAHRRPRLHELAAQVLELGVELGDARVLRQVLALVRELLGTRVELLDVEQAELVGGRCSGHGLSLLHI